MKKGKILIDKVNVLDFDFQVMFAETHVYRTNTKEEVLFLKFNNNGTKEFKGDDYVKIYFNQFDVLVVSKELFFGFKGEMLLKKLLLDGVMNSTGTIDQEEMLVFSRKYHQELLRLD
ncbi:MAG: hypothetical protein K9J17_08460 [Flavobacteriales bacterium]|nr:hypothetical protein [Flavobacteriales bacterium]